MYTGGQACCCSRARHSLQRFAHLGPPGTTTYMLQTRWNVDKLAMILCCDAGANSLPNSAFHPRQGSSCQLGKHTHDHISRSGQCSSWLRCFCKRPLESTRRTHITLQNLLHMQLLILSSIADVVGNSPAIHGHYSLQGLLNISQDISTA